MIEPTTGDLLAAPVEALVNTVNCKGVMGKGIALQFRKAFPESYTHYREACKAGDVRLGKVLVFDRGGLADEDRDPRYIIQFPTKAHWKNDSHLPDIEAGLDDLVATVRRLKIQSIAVPPLGTGNGNLPWKEVRPRIEAAFAAAPDVRVLLYEPGSAPRASELSVRTERPRMTRGRAVTVALVEAYRTLDYPLTAIEAQKLAYFGSEIGLLERLSFEARQFGPYAQAFEHVLQAMDGHFVAGVGDRDRSRMELRLLPGAVEEAATVLRDQPAEQASARLDAVRSLIEGFETPYGMELLATVHWVMTRKPGAGDDLTATVKAVHQWSDRKRRQMPAADIEEAWCHLREQGWTPAPAPAMPLEA